MPTLLYKVIMVLQIMINIVIHLFQSFQKSYIDKVMANFSAVRGCNSEQAVEQNQENIVKYVFECLKGGVSFKNYVNKSYFGFYEGRKILVKCLV